MELWQARAYRELEAFLEATARVSGTGAVPQVAAARQVLSRMRRAEELRLDRADPAQVPLLYFGAMLRGDGAALEDLSAAGAATGPGVQREFTRGLRGALGGELVSLSRLVVLDGLLANLKAEVEPGGPPWRVHLTTPDLAPDAWGKQPRGVDAWMVLVKEKGLPRVLSFAVTPAELGLLALRLVQEGDLPGARRVLGWAKGTKATRPGSMFALLLPSVEQGGREELLRASAALGAFSGDPARVLPTLLEARASATGAARHQLSLVALAALGLGRPLDARAGPLAQEVAAEDPEALKEATMLKLQVALSAGRLPEARAVAADLEARWPGVQALRLRSEVEASAGEYASALALTGKLLAGTEVSGSDLNSAAWLQLYLQDPPGAAALELGERAVKETQGKSYPVLHTLATAQAFAGRPGEAMATLQRAVQLRGGSVESSDWLVIGRVAEAYGLPEEARAAYQRVEAPRGPPGDSSWELARRRLAVLDAAAKGR